MDCCFRLAGGGETPLSLGRFPRFGRSGITGVQTRLLPRQCINVGAAHVASQTVEWAGSIGLFAESRAGARHAFAYARAQTLNIGQRSLCAYMHLARKCSDLEKKVNRFLGQH